MIIFSLHLCVFEIFIIKICVIKRAKVSGLSHSTNFTIPVLEF